MTVRFRTFTIGVAAFYVLAASPVPAQPERSEVGQVVAAKMTGAEPEAGNESVNPHLAETKLRLEIRNLEAERSWGWLSKFVVPLVGPLAIAIVGAWYGSLLNRRLKAAELEAGRFNAFFDRRAEAYSRAFEILKPTALFFHMPINLVEGDGAKAAPREQEARQITREDCRYMGRQLSGWYFGAGGLLMTGGARDAYFALAEALRLAAGAADDDTDLAVPTVAEHDSKISKRMISKYREKLAESDLPFDTEAARMLKKIEAGDLENWPFGADAIATGDAALSADDDPAKGLALRYKDFILIQALASWLRTELTADLGSREPPIVRANLGVEGSTSRGPGKATLESSRL